MSVLSLVILSAALSVTPTPVPPFEFSPSAPLQLTWTLPDAAKAGAPGAGDAGASPLVLGGIDLLNNERISRGIQLDLQLRAEDGVAVDTARLLTLQPLAPAASGAAADREPLLPSAGALRIQLLARDAGAVKPGTFSGYLTASSPTDPHVARVPVRLQLSRASTPPAMVGAEPLVPSLIAHVTTLPGCDAQTRHRIWLPAVNVQGPPPTRRLGTLVGSQGGSAQVFWTDEHDEDRGLALGLSCMSPPGEYTGKIMVPSASGPHEVQLTVHAKHKVALAALALTLGVLGALLFQWLSAVVLEQRELKRRVAQLSQELSDVWKNTAFDPIRKEESAALEKWNTSMKERIRKATDFGSASADHQAILAELTTMEQRIRAAKTFPALSREAEQSLQQALEAWPDQIRPSRLPPQPVFAENLSSLLEPPTFSSAIDQGKALQEVSALAKVFGQAGTRLQELHDWAEAHQALKDPPLTAAEADRLQNTRELMSKVRHDFWHAAHREELGERNTLAELRQAEAQLASLDYRRPPMGKPRGTGLTEEAVSPIAAILSLFGQGLESPLGIQSTYGVQERREASRLMASSALIVLASIAIAVVTGLNELYFPKPFGLWSDYLQAFFWGVLTQVTVTTTVNALPRLVGSFRRAEERA